MLRQLLQRLNQGGVFTISDLAAALDTSEALVEQMIEDLVRRGYLAPAADRSNVCETCPLRGVICWSPAALCSRLLVLTPKGQRGKT